MLAPLVSFVVLHLVLPSFWRRSDPRWPGLANVPNHSSASWVTRFNFQGQARCALASGVVVETLRVSTTTPQAKSTFFKQRAWDVEGGFQGGLRAGHRVSAGLSHRGGAAFAHVPGEPAAQAARAGGPKGPKRGWVVGGVGCTFLRPAEQKGPKLIFFRFLVLMFT